MTTIQPQPDLDPVNPDELFPEMMIYMTVRLHADGRWSDNIKVQTPDGRCNVANYGRSGGFMLYGEGKCVDDLRTAFIHAMESLEPFNA